MLEKRWTWKSEYSLLIILVLASALRIYHLGYKSIWYDEAVSFFLAREGYKGLALAKIETAQPLYPLLLYHVINILGTKESALRSLSLMLGVFSLYAGYKLFETFSEKKIALISSLLLALSPFHIWYSQEARAYTLFLFLSLLCIYYYWRFIKEGRIKDLIFFTIASILNLYTHYYAVLVIFILYSYILFLYLRKEINKRLISRFFITLFLTILFFAPYILKVAVKQISYNSWQYARLDLKNLYQLSQEFNIFAPLVKSNQHLLLILNLLILFFFFKGVISTLKRRSSFFSLFSLYFITTYLLLTFFISLFKNLYHFRFMIPLLPFYFYFISFSLLSISRKVKYFLSVFFLVLYIFSFSKFESWQCKNNWRDTATYIKNHWEKRNSQIILKPYWTLIPLLYYFPEARGEIVEKFSRMNKRDSSLWVILSYGWEKKILNIACFLNKQGYYIKNKRFYKGIDSYKFIRIINIKKGEENGSEKFRGDDETGSRG